jgi:hypothetical protein
MNGNNSPSNGKVTIYDEMLADMTPNECTERMEYYKTIVGCVPLGSPFPVVAC